MRNVNVTITCETRDVVFDKSFVGLTGENLQGKIIVDFCRPENFVDGTGYLEISRSSGKFFIEMDKDAENHTYSIDILSSLLCGCEKMICQFRVTQEADAGGNIPVFKSKEFIMPCLESICATEEIPQQYPSWKDQVDEDIADLKSDKADKVEDAVNGNFAGLDANGNLTDSGSKASDFLTEHQDISGKEDTSNKASAIDNDNKTSETEYTSVKAVVDYIDASIIEVINTPI